jgi:thiamine-monophosphate kinase
MTENNRLTTLGEFGLIEYIQSQVDPSPFLRLGIGDDCSIQTVGSDEELLTSTDLLIEGVHFNLDWTNFEQLGRKSVAVNVSDIAAMGGTPRSLYLGLAFPATLSLEHLEQFLGGVLSKTKDYGAVLAGGDTCRSTGPLIISVTVQGAAKSGQAICRSGAQPGDLIYVSGTLGDSALVLHSLQNNEQPASELAERHHCPEARTELGRSLADQGLANAMIDISDGLVADLNHILKASDKGAVLSLEHIPLSATFQQACQEQSGLIDLALTWGEDYELLFTASPAAEKEIVLLSEKLKLSLSKIGSVNDGNGLNILQKDGALYQYRQAGFDHFASEAKE